MAQSKYEIVCSILRGESIGCVNVGNHEEFDKIASGIIGFGCFKNVVYSALIDQLAERVKEYGEDGLLDEEYCFDVLCEDKIYRFAYQLSGILFPPVLCFCEMKDEKTLITHESVYAFRKMNKYDVENIADMFNEKKKGIIRDNLSTCKTTEDATEIIINGLLVTPF